ncbi:MAG: 23S rRNA (pseudouridine(1915)-N(3))-methyltransferase RlmH [Paludibacteraceae bacterium]|jgi:23S rRNA (pseudouridine1915-N3)-methyltransferase|nr:23S rRNA (pseudouridine(1915)-N(3))-methyltransferase RlmH [Paludibacteraceae bacterium]
MKITLLVVGKTTDSHIQALLQDYQKRLGHYIPFSLTVIPELKNTKSLTSEQQKQAEGELILRNMTASTDMILLDERGKEFRSVEFADYVQKKMSSGRDLVFVVGGPYGFSEAVYQRANGQISLSQMTFSHQMVRLFFVEQIYRAMTILRGEPYHHE